MDSIRTGRDIFNLPKDEISSQEQIKEIWFTFNLITNFIENPNFAPGGNVVKIVKWFESIAHAYPNDASMCAALARGYRLLEDEEKFHFYQQRFIDIISKFSYWQRRIKEFPELLEFAEVPAPKVSIGVCCGNSH